MKRFLQQLWGNATPPDPDPGDHADTESDAQRVLARDEQDRQAWIGIGLDGTLSRGADKRPDEDIGEPVALMVERVRHWLEHGYRVKILTGRAARAENIPAIQAWLRHHGLPELEITHRKDLHMVEFWDDKAIQVVGNTGRPVGKSRIPRPSGTEPKSAEKSPG